MNLNAILKDTAEELFWLGFGLVLAWYAAVNWPISAGLSTLKFTLLYFPFTAASVFLVKEGFFGYSRLAPMLVLCIATGLSLVHVLVLYLEYARQFFRDQSVPLSSALKANDLMNVWSITAQQPEKQAYFLVLAGLLSMLLLIFSLRAGFLLPRNR